MSQPRRKQRNGDTTPAAPARPGAFLGTLRSEFDEPEILPEGFKRLHQNVEDLLAAYEGGRLAQRELAERLAQQRATDRDGGEWTVGATTLMWYRRQGPLSSWMQVPPPSQAIGEPMPGMWQNAIDIPEMVEDDQEATVPPVPQTVPVPAQEPSTPERKMEFPSEYIPGGAAAATGAVSYEENFDAGLAALLGGDLDEAPPSSAEAGPAPRAGSSEQLGLGSGAYLGDEDEGLDRNLTFEETGGSASSYGNFVDGIKDVEDVAPYLDEGAGGSVTGPGELDDILGDLDWSTGETVPEPPAEEFELPPGFYWDTDEK